MYHLRGTEIMAKPLDGIVLLTYFRRLGFSREAQELLTHIRTSPPSRTPGNHRGNMPVWYPSKKMQCIVKAESAKVEFPFLLAAEHDGDILEVWDQPPAIPLEYYDKRGRLQRPLHTADYFLFRYGSAGWIECKPAQELHRLAEKQPNRYVLDEGGVWRCPPGEAFAKKYGLTYHVWSSDQINWAAQDNTLYLEDYYQHLERLTIPQTVLETLYRLVDEHPGIMLADLRGAAHDIPADFIHIAIARSDLYVDLATYRLSEPWHTPVFRTQPIARSSLEPSPKDHAEVTASTETLSCMTPEGQALLERASDTDLATALFRNRVIHPEHYDDEEQAQTAEARAAVPVRTRQRWQQWYREAENRYGSGFLGLLPRYHNCGGNRKIASEVITLMQRVLETQYDTVTRKPKRGAYGEYLRLSEEQYLKPVGEPMDILSGGTPSQDGVRADACTRRSTRSLSIQRVLPRIGEDRPSSWQLRMESGPS
jgi:putative transposase